MSLLLIKKFLNKVVMVGEWKQMHVCCKSIIRNYYYSFSSKTQFRKYRNEIYDHVHTTCIMRKVPNCVTVSPIFINFVYLIGRPYLVTLLFLHHWVKIWILDSSLQLLGRDLLIFNVSFLLKFLHPNIINFIM